MSSRIRLLIADDHPLIRSGLRALLERGNEFEVIAEAADGYQAIELALSHKPAVMLLDVGMPRLSGIDAAQAICDKMPGSQIIMVSMHSDEGYVLRALKAGARGYLLKASPEADVIAAVRAVAAGNAYFSPSITKLLVEECVEEVRRRGVNDSYDLLGLREKEILRLLASANEPRNRRDVTHLIVHS